VPKDGFGREIDYLRISLTDQCNLRCLYCMPLQAGPFAASAALLTPAEIEAVARVALRSGFRRLRLTGGEPTLRPELLEIVERLAALSPEDLAMTTNAVRLPALAGSLARAGLRRVNIHVDSLDPRRLPQLMRWGNAGAIEAGIAAAEEAGLLPIKINCVVVRGHNDEDDVVGLAQRARTRGWHVRFIEMMPLGAGEPAQVARTGFVPSRATRLRIEAAFGPLAALPPAHASDESQNFRFADGAPGTIGFISPVSEPYCGSCNRMRLTADGKFHLCLLNDDALDVRRALRGGGGPEEVARILARAVSGKPIGHHLSDGVTVMSRQMFQVGG
jgi:cyclic pyranopterin phosphate synthase